LCPRSCSARVVGFFFILIERMNGIIARIRSPTTVHMWSGA
jgi:hypothetical protein